MFVRYMQWQQSEARRPSLKAILAGWAVAELLALVIALKVFGLGGTILLTVMTSLIGVIVLRRIGFEAARNLRTTFGSGGSRDGALADGVLGSMGALLLILPGFVSDLVGLALATPSIRQALAARFGGAAGVTPARPATPDVIDLSPTEWRVVERPNVH